MIKKEAIRLVHLWLGMISGLIISLICISGAVFVFAEEIMHAYNKQYLYVTPEVEKKPVDQLLNAYRVQFPDEEYYWLNTYNNPARSYNVVSGIPSDKGSGHDVRLKLTFINPYSGNVIGKDISSAHFLYLVAHFHSELLLGNFGLWVIRIATVIFLIELILGLILWWPTNKNKIKSAFKPTHKPSSRFIYDLHNVYGFYALWFLLISVSTGLIITFEWVEKPVLSTFGGSSELVGKQVPHPPIKADKTFVSDQFIYEEFEREYPEGHKLTFMALYPDSMVTSQFIIVDKDKHFLHLYGDHMVIDRYTGKQSTVPKIDAFEKNQDINETVMNLHTGNIGGWPVKLLALIIALFGASLPVTGFLMWWRSRKEKSNLRKELDI